MKTIKNKNNTRDLIIASLLVATGLILPTIFHTFNLGGPVFLPMHIPVFLCGLLVGARYGLLSGLAVPILSSIITGMPPLFPVAITMSIELGVYGLMSGLLRRKVNIYASLIGAQVIGRLAGAIGSFLVLGLAGKPFAFPAYFTSVFVTGLPGIILQIMLIPATVIIIEKAGFNKNYA